MRAVGQRENDLIRNVFEEAVGQERDYDEIINIRLYELLIILLRKKDDGEKPWLLVGHSEVSRSNESIRHVLQTVEEKLYFTLSAELSYQRFILKDWSYLYIKLNNGEYMSTGNCNNLSLNLTLARNSTDNPIFPRRGSEFSASVQLTPPYSLFSNKDYSVYGKDDYDEAASMFNWIEYHKWKFKSKTYTALTGGQKCPVIMTRAEFGLLGHYNKYKKSPFETFYMGGDGMTGYSTSYASETIALRGYENGSLTPYGSEGYAYVRLGAELRYPLMLENSTSIYALGFIEGGNAWTDVSKFNPFQLKRSAGVGVRIFLPMIGMMGIDWAYGFDKINGSSQYSGSQFHFILGQEF